MLERWDIGFQKDISHFNFIVNPVGGGTINPILQYPRPIIPLFQYSNCERSELSSLWMLDTYFPICHSS